jgi:hypothetical protein
MFTTKNARLKIAEDDARREAEELRIDQLRIGDQIYNSIRKAARENKVFNKPYELIGYGNTFIPGRRENNGMSYTITVGIPDDRVSAGFIFDEKGRLVKGVEAVVIYIDLSRAGNEIHMMTGPYGKNEAFSINYLQDFIEIACNIVRNFRRYPD